MQQESYKRADDQYLAEYYDRVLRGQKPSDYIIATGLRVILVVLGDEEYTRAVEKSGSLDCPVVDQRVCAKLGASGRATGGDMDQGNQCIHEPVVQVDVGCAVLQQPFGTLPEACLHQQLLHMVTQCLV